MEVAGKEFEKAAESFLHMWMGDNNLKRWLSLRSQLHFQSNAVFADWLLNSVEQQQPAPSSFPFRATFPTKVGPAIEEPLQPGVEQETIPSSLPPIPLMPASQPARRPLQTLPQPQIISASLTASNRPLQTLPQPQIISASLTASNRPLQTLPQPQIISASLTTSNRPLQTPPQPASLTPSSRPLPTAPQPPCLTTSSRPTPPQPPMPASLTASSRPLPTPPQPPMPASLTASSRPLQSLTRPLTGLMPTTLHKNALRSKIEFEKAIGVTISKEEEFEEQDDNIETCDNIKHEEMLDEFSSAEDYSEGCETLENEITVDDMDDDDVADASLMNTTQGHVMTSIYPEYFKSVCNMCGKKCEDPSALTLHSQTHAETEVPICTYCGKKFTSSSNLKQHVRSKHFNFKPHVCPYCSKAFCRSYVLKSHLPTCKFKGKIVS